MTRIDKLILGLILGGIFPISLFLIGWWTTYKTSLVSYFALGGFFVGILVNIIFLKKWILNAFEIPVWVLISMYLFYNLCIYGLFMGFPVFNLLMGLVAGYYFGKRINYKKISLPEIQLVIKRISFFTVFIMLIICISTGLIAMTDKYVGKDLQSMLGLKVEVSKTIILGIILIGGLILVIAQYFITKIAIRKTIKYTEQNSNKTTVAS